jgi:hypothetical protein
MTVSKPTARCSSACHCRYGCVVHNQWLESPLWAIVNDMADGAVTAGITMRLRIGVSGHRTVTAELPGLTSEISKAVEYITQKLAVVPDTPLTVVSSLALPGSSSECWLY